MATGKVATGLVNSELVNITEQVDTGAVVLERDMATSITDMAITDRVDSLPEVTGQADLVGLVPMDQLDTGQVDTGQDGTGQVDKDTDQVGTGQADREQVFSTEVTEVAVTGQADSRLGATDRAHKLEMDMLGIIIINA